MAEDRELTDAEKRRVRILSQEQYEREAEIIRKNMSPSGFGTRKDGRVYPKGTDKLILNLRGKVGQIEKYDKIIDHFKNVADQNHLPPSYAYHLIQDVSVSTLTVRFGITRDEALNLKSIAQARWEAEEGGR